MAGFINSFPLGCEGKEKDIAPNIWLLSPSQPSRADDTI
jgi:hypothetical protein